MDKIVRCRLSSRFTWFSHSQDLVFSPFAHPHNRRRKFGVAGWAALSLVKGRHSVRAVNLRAQMMDLYQEAVDYLESQQVPGEMCVFNFTAWEWRFIFVDLHLCAHLLTEVSTYFIKGGSYGMLSDFNPTYYSILKKNVFQLCFKQSLMLLRRTCSMRSPAYSLPFTRRPQTPLTLLWVYTNAFKRRPK